MTFRDWVKASFDQDTLMDIVEHGANHGWPHITYTKDIITLYDRFRDDLWACLADHNDGCGYSPIEILSASKHKIYSHADLATFMVWFSVEFLARELSEDMNHVF